MNNLNMADELPPHDEDTADDVHFPDMSEFSITIVGPGAVFKGDVVSDRGVSIFGKVLGNVNCEDGLLHVGDTGIVTGNIEGYNVEVDGLVEGHVLARHTLTIKGKIRGDMDYMSELCVGPHLDIDGRIRKIKADTASTFAPERPVFYVATESPQSVPDIHARQVKQPYAHGGYIHVAQSFPAKQHVPVFQPTIEPTEKVKKFR